MSLHKLARELDETARQSSAMLSGITDALALLTETAGNDANVHKAVAMIVTALQGQDRIEQRCHGMAAAVRQFEQLPAGTPASAYDAIWAGLTLDELRVPALSGIATRHKSDGDAELF